MTVALALLATLAVETPVWRISLYMVVLGLGLGMVMQVLVLAVQNAVAVRAARSRDLGIDAVPPDRRVHRRRALRRGLRQPAPVRARRSPPAGRPRAERRQPVSRRASPARRARALRRSVLRRPHPRLRRRGGSRCDRVRAHLAAARDAAAQDRALGRPRRELRVSTRRQLVPRARALPQLARTTREPLGRVRAVRRPRGDRTLAARAVAPRAHRRAPARHGRRAAAPSSGSTSPGSLGRSRRSRRARS